MLSSLSSFAVLDPHAPMAVVAVPAKNEAERLAACLDALEKQIDGQGGLLPAALFGVLFLVNNACDDSAEIIRKYAVGSRLNIRVVEVTLPAHRSHAGGARRAAMDMAADWLDEAGPSSGVLLTSDADSRVAPDWLWSNLRAFSDGAETVLGQISLDEESALLSPALHARGKLESVYGDLLTELERTTGSASLQPVAASCDSIRRKPGGNAGDLSPHRRTAARAARRGQGACCALAALRCKDSGLIPTSECSRRVAPRAVPPAAWRTLCACVTKIQPLHVTKPWRIARSPIVERFGEAACDARVLTTPRDGGRRFACRRWRRVVLQRSAVSAKLGNSSSRGARCSCGALCGLRNCRVRSKRRPDYCGGCRRSPRRTSTSSRYSGHRSRLRTSTRSPNSAMKRSVASSPVSG